MLKCRLIEPVAEALVVHWEEKGSGDHNHKEVRKYPLGTRLEEVPSMEEISKQLNIPLTGMGLHTRYNTESGKPEPGDMFWFYPVKEWVESAITWDNHPGKELHVICPDGHEWNIDSRAKNCSLPKDNLHRCWIRHGEPPNITVMRKGEPVGGEGGTCTAGSSSIDTGSYHGFLKNGCFT